MECSICGISGEMRNVVEVISSKGVVLACEKCALEEGYPVLKKTDKAAFEKTEKGTVYERMARLAGVEPRERRKERPELKTEEQNLRQIVNRNYEEKIKKTVLGLRTDLTDKFQWIIMRVRRIKGLTQKELAEKIGESEAAVKMAEQGIVPEGYVLIDKLERFLKVKLIKERIFKMPEPKIQAPLQPAQPIQKEKHIPYWIHTGNRELPKEEPREQKKDLGFDKQALESLTISDLQRMKKEKEEKKQEEEKRRENGS